MIHYNELTAGQLRYVNMVNLFHPEIEDTITFAQINKIHEEFLGLRPKYKIGFPLWIVSENRIGKGLYSFPKEGVDSQEKSGIIVSEHERLYLELLFKFNLKGKL